MEQRLRGTFFNGVWLYGAGLLLLLGMALRQPALSIFAALTLLVAGISKLWGRHALDHLIYERHLSAQRAFPGEMIELTISLTNGKWLPLTWLELEDQVSDRLKVRDQESLPSNRPGTTVLRLTTAARPYERIHWRFQIDCPHRGAFSFGPASLRSGDLFGFFTRQERREVTDRLLVYPRIVPLEGLGLPPLQPCGEARAFQHLVPDPSRTVGVREYRPDDAFRFVHWKATARLREVQVKVFEPAVTVQAGIFLNLDSYERPWEGIDYLRVESAIVAAASLARHALDAREQVGVYSNGVLVGSDQHLRVRPGLGPNQFQAILEGLAKLTPLASTSFVRLLRLEAPRFVAGSTLVVITAVMTESLVAALAELLVAGRRVVLLTVGETEAPELPGLIVHPVPENLAGDEPALRPRYLRVADIRG